MVKWLRDRAVRRISLVAAGLVPQALLLGCTGKADEVGGPPPFNAGEDPSMAAGTGGWTSGLGTGAYPAGGSAAGSAGQLVGGAGGTTPPSGGGAGSGGQVGEQALLPCDVADVVTRNCATCHGVPPVTAPMSLVSHQDIQRPGILTQTKSVSELIQQRIHDPANPMPPLTSAPLDATDMAILDAWLAQGAPAGAPGCSVRTPGAEEEEEEEEERDLPPDAVCYELRNHGQPVAGDTTPYTAPMGEQYVEFHFDTPYTEPSVMVGWRTLYDKREVLHHWLFYNTKGASRGGDIRVGIGTHLGDQVELMAGWAVGGNDMELPEGVAAALPPPGGKMFVEWHYFNSTGAPVQDRSGLEICVVPASSVDPAKVAGVTWIGSEYLGGILGMPPNTVTKIKDVCTPRFAGLPPGEPARIFGWNPHMHNIGAHMKTWLVRQNGTVEPIFDKPFQFDHQINYRQDPLIEVYPGDRIVNECTFNNTTNGGVAFGPSSTQEMCYQFTFAYPQSALSNGVFSLTGATNTCWDNNPVMAQTLVPD